MNIKPFKILGDYLREHSISEDVMRSAEDENHFFTRENILRATDAIVNDILTCEIPSITPKYRSCAVIMAGNIPMVGFLDMMCCSVSGVDTYIKPSSKDRVLMGWLVERLVEFGCKNIFYWNESIAVESVIATGSNNAGRYFELRFGSLPSVVRGSRSSVAVIDGTESDEEIDALWHDIFDYYGLGCRSVSHLFIAEGYDVESLFKSLASKTLTNIHFINAYRQSRAVKTMMGETFFDGGYFIAYPSLSLTPALGELTYSYYRDGVIEENAQFLQCVVGHGHIAFGHSQRPLLGDWPDGINLFNDFLVKM